MTDQSERPLIQTSDQRKAAMDAALSRYGASGWRIENRSDYQATIATGKQVSHVLHLLLTLVTAGIWLIFWLGFGVLGGVKRRLVSIDEYGNVVEQKI